MEPILSRCGYRCDLCLAYAPNVSAHPENQQKLSDGWFTHFGFRIQPEDILCDGCWSENSRLIDAGCPVRPCVIARGLQNCAYCNQLDCTLLAERLVVRKEIEQRLGASIPEEDYRDFIRPYENASRLQEIRSSLCK